ncbi:MAG: acetoin utilization protein AcuC [Sciscionella sp.]
MGEPAAVVWDEKMLAYNMGEGHPFNPVRIALTMRLATALGVLDGIEPQRPTEAADSELERFHRASYLRAVRLAPELGEDLPHGLGTEDNPIFTDMHAATALVVGGSLRAAREIASGRVRRAVNVSGGLHHAMPGHASGFCVYNDCAVTISWLLDHGFDRIAYLDADVHHGDGVQHAFYGDPRVLTVSLHQHPKTLWPGTGFPHEVGGPGAEGYAVNLPLLPRTGDAEWLRAFDAVVPSLLGSFRPQILLTQCGVDTHHEDPLADLSLHVDGHREIYRRFRDLAQVHTEGRWLAVGGGGYALLRAVPRSWTHLLAIMLDRDIEPATAIPVDWIELVSDLAPGAALPDTMGENADVAVRGWSGGDTDAVDLAIADTRHAVFPLHGLDPDDPRD